MDPQLQHTLLTKFAPVAGGIIVILGVARFRGIPWREGLGLRWPPLRAAATWLLIWFAWAVLQELLIAHLGLEQPARWPEYSPAVFWLRVATIGVVGPAAEELFFRGLAFNRLRRTKLRVVCAVLVTAAAWSAMHLQYEPATMALIFLEGLLLGAVRAQTGSVLLPFTMHAAGNLYSIWQSTHA